MLCFSSRLLPLLSRNVGGVNVQDLFSKGKDPAFHSKRGPGPGAQQGGGPSDSPVRMQNDANKDVYGGEEGNFKYGLHVSGLKSLQRNSISSVELCRPTVVLVSAQMSVG